MFRESRTTRVLRQESEVQDRVARRTLGEAIAALREAHQETAVTILRRQLTNLDREEGE